MACEACHTVFPELTHFGRMFKASGYTLDNLRDVHAVTDTNREMLSLSSLPPIAAMVQFSYTKLSSPLPDTITAGSKSLSDNVDFPQQVGLFYAGKIAPHLGAFMQLTYDNGGGTIGIDNTDIRYADNAILPDKTNLIYGVSVNNNPTVQDLWNSTPAFGFPYAVSSATVGPLAGTQIDGGLAQDVAGLSVYALWNEQLYGELGVYRSAKQGAANSITGSTGPLDGATSNVMHGEAPYWRLAYEYNTGRHSIEVGTYGADFKLFPGGGAVLSGPANEFQDVAEDLQYQYYGDAHLFSLMATHIHENLKLNATFAAGGSANASDSLTTTRVIGTYYYKRKIGGSVAYFSTTGSTDAGLYPAGGAPGVVTSANGSPNTNGYIAELNYLPWLNTKLSLQYTSYSKFNGAGSNYDGVGRNASDNNSLYALVWISF